MFPILNSWFIYNRLCDLKPYRYSLFFIQRRAFKMFKKETSQDMYSSKRILEKLFLPLKYSKKDIKRFYLKKGFISLSKSHLCFLYQFKFFPNVQFNLICVHCGMMF